MLGANSYSRTAAGVSEPVLLACRYLAAMVHTLVIAGLPAALVFALCIHASFVESFSVLHLCVVVCVLLCVQLVLAPRLVINRTAILYLCFLTYLFAQTFWTTDLGLALNTLFPAVNFFLILVLVSSNAAAFGVKAASQSALAGFLAGAAVFSVSSGFPLRFPADFSYNATATMYLFGLFLVLMVGLVNPKRLWPIPIALVLLAHIVATTSIKTNLGLLIGFGAASAVSAGFVSRVLWRRIGLLFALLAFAVGAVVQNAELREGLERGTARIVLGVQVLQAREDVAGYGAMNKRNLWMRDGVEGWMGAPLFGNGVESFRSRFGVTSHSTPIDLAYNGGLTAVVLFYAVLFTALADLLRNCSRRLPAERFLMLAFLVCFIFITMSATMHYSAFLAVFLALYSVGLPARERASLRGQHA